MMAYGANDIVLYGSQGVCRVAEISENNLLGSRMEYYVLKPVYDVRSTFFVPVCNETLTARMRRVLSVEEIYALIRAMPQEEPIWVEDEMARKKQYKDILSCGDRMALIRLIKTLYLHQQAQIGKGRKLRNTDEIFMREAEKMLYEEFAYVLNINLEQVVPLIHERLQGVER